MLANALNHPDNKRRGVSGIVLEKKIVKLQLKEVRYEESAGCNSITASVSGGDIPGCRL
jgi:hypothetical protein